MWTVGGLASLDLLPKDVTKHFNTPEKRVAWAVRVCAGLLTIVGIVNYFTFEKGILHDFCSDQDEGEIKKTLFAPDSRGGNPRKRFIAFQHHVDHYNLT